MRQEGKYGLIGQSVISIEGTADLITNTINLCIDILNQELRKNDKYKSRKSRRNAGHRSKFQLKMLIESTNIDMFNITKGICGECNVLIKVYPKSLPFSTERLIEIGPHPKDNGNAKESVKRLKLAVKMIIDRWFNDHRYIDTEKEYSAMTEYDANFNHGYAFKDSYHEGLLQLLGADGDSQNVQDVHPYYDRIKYFPLLVMGQVWRRWIIFIIHQIIWN